MLDGVYIDDSNSQEAALRELMGGLDSISENDLSEASPGLKHKKCLSPKVETES